MTNLVAIALASVVAAASAPAEAIVEPAQDSAIVRFNDLDLATAQGMDKLDRRIERAARRICRPDGKLTLHEAREASECMEEAKARASDDVLAAAVQFGPRAIQLAQQGSADSAGRP